MEANAEGVHGPGRLRVYHLAQDLAASIDQVVRTSAIGDSLADQLRRAADSIVLNIAEGCGHFSPGRKVYHYQMARGSADECIGALSRLHRRQPSDATASARRSANMVSIMLTGLIRTHEARR